MQISILRDNLFGALQNLSSVVEKKNNAPILANILVEVKDKSLYLTSSNGEVQLVCKLDDIQIKDPGKAITVPGRKFFDIVKNLSNGSNIVIKSDKKGVTVKQGKSCFKLSTLDADGYPNVEVKEANCTVSVSQSALKRMIDVTSFSIPSNDVRFYLCGLLLEISNNMIKAVSTDGHRLSIAKEDIDLNIDEPRRVIIPRKSVAELSRLLSDFDDVITLQLDDNHLFSSVGNFCFTSKLIDGRFPDYERVIPKGDGSDVVGDCEALNGMFKRASILSHENLRGVKLNLTKDSLRITANNPEHEQAEDLLDVDYRGDEMDIGFNVSYLIDVMNTIKEEKVQMKFIDPFKSITVQPLGNPNNLFVVMPMRI